MQNSADLWSLLCEELQTRRQHLSRDEQAEAARNFEQAAKQVFGKNLPRLRDALEISGDVHQAVGFEADALRCYGEALRLAVTAEAHPLIVRIATKLALLHEAAGDAPLAVRHYTQAVESSEAAHLHSELPTLLNNLARQERQLGDFARAERDYLRALQEAEHIFGKNHPEVALIANNLGVAYMERNDFAKAEEMHFRALSIREANFGANHPDTAQSLGNLAVLYHARGEFRKAERFYKSALEIYANFRSIEDADYAQLRESFERLPQNLAQTRRITPPVSRS